MAIVPTVGRRSLPIIGFISLSYVLLVLGGVTMVIPFLIMLTSSVANDWDYERFNFFPRYAIDRRERYMKFLAEKYLDIQSPRLRVARDFRLFSAAYNPAPHWGSFRALREDPDFADTPPFLFGAEARRDAQLRRIRQDYLAWMDTYDQPLLTLPMFARFVRCRYQTAMQDFYETEFLQRTGAPRSGLSRKDIEQGALRLMAEAWQEAKFKRFFYLELLTEGSYPYHLRIWLPALDERRWQDYMRFVSSLPGDWKLPITAQHLWVRFLENAAGDMAAFRAQTGLEVNAYHEVRFPDTEPAIPVLRELWLTFTQEKWPLWMVELPPEMAPDYRAYLRGRTGSLTRLNRMIGSDYESWDDIAVTGRAPVAALERNFWRDYLQQLPGDVLARHRVYPEQSYRQFLRQRYGTVERVDAAYGWNAGSFSDIMLPVAEVDYAQFLDQETWFVKAFLSFNFAQVFRYMATQGRAVLNTLILVSLSILSCLTVNPLAAYALSRFHMRSAHRVLLFLLATMAFPHEVAMIPNFLLLRELGLLNTYAALVLPRLANGFGIFLLKGFFDSLPRELYEAATIDGASEFRMFTQITLPLSKPILAYQALLTFIATYGGFMWAFLVCQDPRMWTLMVWMYQYQQSAAAFPYMVMAAFVLASLPTLFVFVFCQRIILRGIIIPTMK